MAIKYNDLYMDLRARLRAAGAEDATQAARELVCTASGKTKNELLRDGLLYASPEVERTAYALCARHLAGEPVAYLIGEWEFYGLGLDISPAVLIPRPDTEVLVQTVIHELDTGADCRVLDLCAGSGCLGLGIRRFCPEAEVIALEKSAEALCYLRENAEKALAGRGVAAPAVRVAEGDIFLFQDTLPPAELDLIVSNPPYLTAEEMRQLQPEVAFEPAMALDGGRDGGDFYRHIAAAYGDKLKPGGWLVLEIGCGQQALLRGILAGCGWVKSVECRKDYGGNDRVILAQHR